MITKDDIKDMTDINSASIKVTNVIEHEDGSATYSFDMDGETTGIVAEIGLKALLFCGAFQITTEQMFDMLLEGLKKERS